MSTLTAWVGYPESHRGLPPDLTANHGPFCGVGHPKGVYTCTRRPSHIRRHAAGNGTHIVAVWP